jgi:hypothetical protein
MTFPRRVNGPMFKDSAKAPKVARRVRKTLARRLIENEEERHKREVRLRDRYCRFPLCECRKFGLALHVSHSRHKGAGGNPKGDRSLPELMVLIDAARHRENRMSIDRGNVKWEPLTKAGSNGPIYWLVNVPAMKDPHAPAKWVEVAREIAPHVYQPFTPKQRAILEELAGMEI